MAGTSVTEAKGRGPGRPTNQERAESLAQAIESGLHGLADLLERRDELDDADTFAKIIDRDAHSMAVWLAAFADQYTWGEKAIRWLFGAGSLVGFAGAFGPLVSRLIDRIRLSDLLDFSGGGEDDLPQPAQ